MGLFVRPSGWVGSGGRAAGARHALLLIRALSNSRNLSESNQIIPPVLSLKASFSNKWALTKLSSSIRRHSNYSSHF